MVGFGPAIIGMDGAIMRRLALGYLPGVSFFTTEGRIGYSLPLVSSTQS